MVDGQMRFDGEVAIVTGAGGALGGAYAQMLAARGASVIVNDISDTANAVVAKIIAAGGIAEPAIMSATDQSRSIVDRTLDRFGRIDIVINNAGMAGGGSFADLPSLDWKRIFDSHVESTVEMSRAAWPHLVASGSGRLVNTSSTSIFGTSHTSAYIAGKGAIFALTRALSLEGRDHNIRVNAVMPHAYSQMTAMIPDSEQVEIRRREFQPEKVAGFIAWLVHKSTTVTGYTLEAGGGRAANVFLAEAEPVIPDNSGTPEAWTAHEEALTSMTPYCAPTSLFDELRIRWQSLGLRSALTDMPQGTAAGWDAGRGTK